MLNPPVIQTRIENTTVTLNFDPIEGAIGYKLYYAPNLVLCVPLSSCVIDLKTATTFSYDLNANEFYAVAISSIDADNTEAFSNIELISLNQSQAGGASSVSRNNPFATPIPNLSEGILAQHQRGKERFQFSFDEATGLGPLYNQKSCQSCHINGGRGLPPSQDGDSLGQIIIRLTLALDDPALPFFTDQLTDKSVDSTLPHAEIKTIYSEATGRFDDGAEERTSYNLRNPNYSVKPFRNLRRTTTFSARIAPPLFGMGLLMAIDPADILKNEDPDDKLSANGITGRANYITNEKGEVVLGRFGLKANSATLESRIAHDLHRSMGLTSRLYPTNITTGNPLSTSEVEINDATLNDLTQYIKTLGAPVTNHLDAVKKGAAHFVLAGCAQCHITTFKTGNVVGFPALSNQIIHPYTDLLLHDMGAGLADNRPDGIANGNEWRTAPLWGIGLTESLAGTGNAFYLHDGRARSLTEAILWHGGEALSAQRYFRGSTQNDSEGKPILDGLNDQGRQELIEFLKSL